MGEIANNQVLFKKREESRRVVAEIMGMDGSVHLHERTIAA